VTRSKSESNGGPTFCHLRLWKPFKDQLELRFARRCDSTEESVQRFLKAVNNVDTSCTLLIDLSPHQVPLPSRGHPGLLVRFRMPSKQEHKSYSCTTIRPDAFLRSRKRAPAVALSRGNAHATIRHAAWKLSRLNSWQEK
jgi:hypothetical protein